MGCIWTNFKFVKKKKFKYTFFEPNGYNWNGKGLRLSLGQLSRKPITWSDPGESLQLWPSELILDLEWAKGLECRYGGETSPCINARSQLWQGGNLMGQEKEKVFREAGARLPSFLWWKEIHENWHPFPNEWNDVTPTIPSHLDLSPLSAWTTLTDRWFWSTIYSARNQRPENPVLPIFCSLDLIREKGRLLRSHTWADPRFYY